MRSASALAVTKRRCATPLGEFRVERAKEVGPGLPVYPAASLVLRGSADAHLPLNDDQPQVIASTYHTNSSREYVANWYLGALESGIRTPGQRP